MKIGIIGAMSIEVDALKAMLEDAKTQTVSGTEFYSGRLFGRQAIIAQSGIGKVAAAVCAQTLILHFGATHIINTGIGGTLTPELGILDVAIANGVVQHDMDTSPIGDPVGLISGINKIVLPTSQELMCTAERAARALGVRYVCGIIASGDQFIASAEKKKFISESFSAVCCEMEGAAIGHVCYLNSVECLIVRTISDSATGEAELEYPEMCRRAAAISCKMTEEIFRLL